MLVATISNDNNGSCRVQPHEATTWFCISSSVSQTSVHCKGSNPLLLPLQPPVIWPVHATQASHTSDAKATSSRGRIFLPRVPSPCSCKGKKISSAFLMALVPNL
uniref:Uncharacterized protein n=1 Tax=Populus trichocarpa TaxID=3694 RepID=A0A3N7EMA9_POPTR